MHNLLPIYLLLEKRLFLINLILVLHKEIEETSCRFLKKAAIR